MKPDTFTEQLASPHPVGAMVALYRTRVYRFSNDPRHYVLAETLEERYAQGIAPASTSLAYVKAVLDQIRSTGQPLPFNPDIAVRENIDIQQELDARTRYAPKPMPEHSPTTTVFIIGAPRSGTSHLYNCLAYTGRYSYFTTASCWAWPVRNLTHTARRSFETMGDQVLSVDNKNTRIIPGLVMPYEAEDLYARAIPAYQHLGGHTYNLTPAQTKDAPLLTANVQAHCRHFNRRAFLTKSPFNSLRIPQLDAATGHRALFVNITRDQAGTADSMRRNRFRFHRDGRPLTEEAAWGVFTTTIARDTPSSRTITIKHRDLLANGRVELDRVRRWIAEA
ncbi:sulfotransferase [Streptomyces sp. NBC_01233]|uniref:sulfotransferase n=1 Tax=Streptomyces sp. NBC_01233 TaxID=2903787 RepID=UPI002E13C040|nr:sulfotransferase [Streptomyces sp. NBC_01233]